MCKVECRFDTRWESLEEFLFLWPSSSWKLLGSPELTIKLGLALVLEKYVKFLFEFRRAGFESAGIEVQVRKKWHPGELS